MKRLINAWLEGWKILVRLTVFGLVLGLVTAPIRLLPELVSVNGRGAPVGAGAWVLAVAVGLAALLAMPLLFVLASRISGEFVSPNAHWTFSPAVRPRVARAPSDS